MAIPQLCKLHQRNNMLQNPRNTDFIVISTWLSQNLQHEFELIVVNYQNYENNLISKENAEITRIVSVHNVDTDNFNFIAWHIGFWVHRHMFKLLQKQPAEWWRARVLSLLPEQRPSLCIWEWRNRYAFKWHYKPRANVKQISHALPKMVCLLSSQGVGTVVMKNCKANEGSENATAWKVKSYLAAIRVGTWHRVNHNDDDKYT